MKIMAKALYILLFCLASLSLSAAETLPDDEAISARINKAFQGDSQYQDALVLVTSERGFVLLTGQVLSQEARDQATNIAAFAGRDIRRIFNELTVMDQLDESTAGSDQTLSATISDRLLADFAQYEQSARVVVHRGIVYLMGAFTSAQAAELSQTVSKIPGIASIKTLFEYKEE